MTERKRRLIPEADLELWDEFINQGSMDARETLILHYQPLVIATARTIGKRVGWRVSQEELVSHGQVGLIKAVEGYNPDIGTFKKYASTYVFGAMIDNLRNADWLPRRYRLAHKEIQKLGDRLGHSTTKEIATELGWDENVVREVLLHVSRAEVNPLPANAYALKHQDQGSDILSVFLSAFDRLTPQQQLIISMRYYGKIALGEISSIIKDNNVAAQHSQAVLFLYDEVQRSIVGD